MPTGSVARKAGVVLTTLVLGAVFAVSLESDSSASSWLARTAVPERGATPDRSDGSQGTGSYRSRWHRDIDSNGSWRKPSATTTSTPTPSTTTTTPSASTTTPSASTTTSTPTSSPTVSQAGASSTPSATTTKQSGTTTSGGLNCAARPSACGYPDATNTGPAAGTTFTKVPSQLTSGPGWAWSTGLDGIRVTGTGAVLSGLDVTGQIIIDAPNVTVKNNIVSVCGDTSDPDVIAVRYKASDTSYRGSNPTISHNTLNGTPAGCSYRARSGVRDIYGEAPNVTVDGNNITGTGNGITVEYSGTIVNNWIHQLGHIAGDHHSGISAHGGAAGLLWQHNTVLLYGQVFAGGGGVSGALTVYADFGHAQNVTAQDNLISGGSYVVYGGNSGDSYSTPSTNVKFLSNRFVCGAWLYGPVAAFNASSSGNAWTGNYCDQTKAAVSG